MKSQGFHHGRRGFLSKTAALMVGAGFIPVSRANALNCSQRKQFDDTVKVKRLSWAGLQIEYDGATLFIDPWINKEIWGTDWNLPVIDVKSNTTANHVAITHAHNDHFDPMAIRSIYGKKRGNVYAGAKTSQAMGSYGIHEIKPVELWEPNLLSAGKITIIAVPGEDFTGIEQYSYVIKVGGRNLFHGGDTLWHGAFHRIGYGFGPFDAVFLPINGVDFLGLKPNSHVPATLTPIHAAAVGEVLQSKLVIPIHYGLTVPDSYVEFPDAEKTLISECYKRKIGVEIVEPGNYVTWKPNR